MVSPSVWLRYLAGAPNPLGMDINARVVYKILWAGINYRVLNGVGGMLGGMFGVNLSNMFDISVAYDYTLAPYTNVYSGGAAELVLGYRLQRKNNGYQSRLFN